MSGKKIRAKERDAIIQSLKAGVTPQSWNSAHPSRAY